ncbi:hypothetical protein APT79_05060 [Enterobacter sp. K66-74]|nr:hypothetical protein APT79_05060 [Enterobacter sp. K66-74]OJX59628.1 MAG: hypothetical protein BGO85_23195 [Enterobacter sp. 56-7]
MLSESDLAYSDLLRGYNQYVGRYIKVNGSFYRDTYSQTLLREVVHAGQALYRAAGGQRVHDEIHRPGQVGLRRAEQRQTFRCQSFTTSSAFYAQPAEMIKAVHALVIKLKDFRLLTSGTSIPPYFLRQV